MTAWMSILLSVCVGAPALVPDDTPFSEPAPDVAGPAAAAEQDPSASLPAMQEATILAPPAQGAVNWYDDLDLNALVSTSYNYNLTLGRSTGVAAANAGRVFDARANSFGIDVALLALQSEAQNIGDVGLRIELVHAPSTARIFGVGTLSLWQAYAAIILPVGAGVRLDAGNFASHIGTEGLDSFDTNPDGGAPLDAANLVYSRSLLFAAIPPLVTGIRATTDIPGPACLQLFVVNGWQPGFIDNNAAKSVAARLQIFARKWLLVTATYLAGAEGNAGAEAWRHLVDASVSVGDGRGGIKAEGLFISERSTAQSFSRRFGALLAGRLQVSSAFALGLRGEYIDARDGFLAPNGAAGGLTVPLPRARLWELTFSPSVALGDSWVARLEVRHDHAADDARPFGAPEVAAASHQTTLAANVQFVF